MKKPTNKLSEGFTLIELLVVIAILGVLAVGLIVAINPQAQLAKARDSTRKAGIIQISKAIQAYAAAHDGVYPTPGWIYSNDPAWQTFLGSELRTVPIDPTQAGCAAGFPWIDGYNCYWYLYYSDGANYIITAHLENVNDPDRCAIKQWKYIDGNSLCATYSWSNYIFSPGSNN